MKPGKYEVSVALRHTTSLLLSFCSIKCACIDHFIVLRSMPSSTFNSQSASSPAYPPNARVSNKASSATPNTVAQQPTASRGMSFMSVEERVQKDKVQRLRGGCIPCPVSLQELASCFDEDADWYVTGRWMLLHSSVLYLKSSDTRSFVFLWEIRISDEWAENDWTPPLYTSKLLYS